MAEPADVAAALERGGPVQHGPGDRFTGYAVLGVSFTSGDVLALRRFPISSTGSGYTSVWHCSPTGRWTFYTDVAGHGCAEYFAPALDEVVVAPIRIEWNGPRRVSIAVDGGQRLVWSLLMRSTPLTRAFNAVGPWLAPLMAKHPRLLRLVAFIARLVFHTGPLRLSGRAPNGAGFAGTPWALWIVRSSRACIGGQDTGPDRPLDRDLALGEFLIPRRGLFAASHAAMSSTVGGAAAGTEGAASGGRARADSGAEVRRGEAGAGTKTTRHEASCLPARRVALRVALRSPRLSARSR